MSNPRDAVANPNLDPVGVTEQTVVPLEEAVHRSWPAGAARASPVAPRKQQVEKVVADLTLDRHILQEIVRKKL